MKPITPGKWTIEKRAGGNRDYDVICTPPAHTGRAPFRVAGYLCRADARFMVHAKAALDAASEFLGAFGGDIPDWLQDEADALIKAMAKAGLP